MREGWPGTEEPCPSHEYSTKPIGHDPTEVCKIAVVGHGRTAQTTTKDIKAIEQHPSLGRSPPKLDTAGKARR